MSLQGSYADEKQLLNESKRVEADVGEALKYRNAVHELDNVSRELIAQQNKILNEDTTTYNKTTADTQSSIRKTLNNDYLIKQSYSNGWLYAMLRNIVLGAVLVHLLYSQGLISYELMRFAVIGLTIVGVAIWLYTTYYNTYMRDNMEWDRQYFGSNKKESFVDGYNLTVEPQLNPDDFNPIY